MRKKTIVVAHKALESDSDPTVARIRELLPKAPIVLTSILDDNSLNNFRRAVFDIFKIIRVYTKHVGEDVKLEAPVILPINGTVEDAAVAIHKEFAAKLRFARVWGEGKFEGQRVQGDFHLSDGDIVEFHI